MKQILIAILVSCLVSVIQTSDDCPNIISRAGWDARVPEIVQYVAFPLRMVIIHHTVTAECSTMVGCRSMVKSIQTYHMDNLNFGDIGYNFLIGGNGKVYEGLGWHKQGAHTYGYNTKSVGIAFIGDFRKKLPTDAAIQAAKKLMACGVKLGELTSDYELYGAKQLSATESPGAQMYNRMMNWDHFTE
ncbi:hypothetical protein RI129_006838 [Pyrocoelia pectoralis]|uniref:Peptidoglycan-recognition protein n=1 Tax=Pyrocoelia pectoralis TaxID=417401 RepID=A0AAN7VEX0_9COLE